MHGQTRILVVGSNEAETNRISSWLEQSRHEVIRARDWARSLRELYSQRPQAVVLLTPSGNGIAWGEVQVLRSLCDIPVIVVADETCQESLQTALDLGLAGLFVRPVDMRRLQERLESNVQRSAARNPVPQAQFKHENLTIDWRKFEIRIDGKVVHLSPIEFKLLALLVERQGEVVSYREILSRVWGPHYDFTERRNIKLYIWYLRRKIEADPSKPQWIVTRTGIGYIFAGEPDAPPTYAETAAPTTLPRQAAEALTSVLA